MSKILISFTSEITKSQTPSVKETFLEGVKGAEITLVVFSKVNRNKAYFQLTQLLEYEDKLTSILHNFNHNLAETGNKYLGNSTKFTEIWEEDGEIWGKVLSTDSAFLRRLPEITGGSVELEIDTDDIKEFADGSGRYFLNIDWVGFGWLTGVVAGSGGARITDIQTFNQTYNLKNIMQENEVKALLEAQKTALTTEFEAKLENLKLEFSKTTQDFSKKFDDQETENKVSQVDKLLEQFEQKENAEKIAKIQSLFAKATNEEQEPNRDGDVGKVATVPSFYTKLNNSN